VSGPPYPLSPVAGSNGIGLFAIGISAVGDIPTFDVWKTVISQYANSPILTTLIGNLFSYLDQTVNIETFFDNVINIDTAIGHGLDVWGNILGVSRTLQVATGDNFGFAEALPGSDSFGQGAFYAGTPLTSNYQLTDAAYRVLLLAKAAANITDCSIPALNIILLSLFPHRGNCYVTDGGDMTMTYTFNFALSPVELAIVENSGVLPKPVGVSATVVIDF